MGKAKVRLIDGAPTACAKCEAPLCLRKQVINLALGNTEEMHCLHCLALESDTTEADVLRTSRGYVMERECFRKEWQKYRDQTACPDRKGCIPDVCFAFSTRGACPPRA
jgi:hypothetical protein